MPADDEYDEPHVTYSEQCIKLPENHTYDTKLTQLGFFDDDIGARAASRPSVRDRRAA